MKIRYKLIDLINNNASFYSKFEWNLAFIIVFICGFICGACLF